MPGAIGAGHFLFPVLLTEKKQPFPLNFHLLYKSIKKAKK
jgi:hypothetical protein